MCLIPLLAAAEPARLTPVYFTQLEQRVAHELSFSLDSLSGSERTPKTLFGEPLGGSFSWSSFAHTLSRHRMLSGKDALAGRDVAPLIRRGLDSEVDGGGVTFSQLFAASILLASCHTPGDLQSSPLWLSLPPERRTAYRSFLDVRRFYDVKTGDMGGRPNNYAAVALLLEAHRTRLGLADDPALLRLLFDRCVGLLERTGGYMDDNRRFEGGYDRYHHEFIRFVWESAEMTRRDDVLEKLRPWMQRSGRLWWDLLDPRTMHGSAWGRSLQNSWDDTYEQAAFFAARPEIAPASTAQLASAFCAAVERYFATQYNAERHLNRMLEPGRGTWSYSGRDRIWGTTVGSFGKLSASAAKLRDALAHQGVASWPSTPSLPPVNRLERFQEQPLRPCAVWIHREPGLSFVLPVVGGGALADYLPAPRGLPGLQTPVEQTLPVLMPRVTTASGLQLTLCQGADSIELDAKADRLTAIWKELPPLKGKVSGVAVGASSSWTVSGTRLEHRIELRATAETALAEVAYWIPLSGRPAGGAAHAFEGPGYRLVLEINAPADARVSLEKPASDAESRGAFEPVTHYLKLTLPARTLTPRAPLLLSFGFQYSFPPSATPKNVAPGKDNI
jgi:hypothetical protein